MQQAIKKSLLQSFVYQCLTLCHFRPPKITPFCPFSIRFSPDKKHVLAGANDGCMYVYDLARGERTIRFSTSLNSGGTEAYDVNTVTYADDSPYMVYSGGDDALCMVWDMRTLNESDPRPVAGLVGHSGGITYIDSKGDGRYLISNAKDQSIKLWDIRHTSDNEAIKLARKAVENIRWDYRFEPPPQQVGKHSEMMDDVSLVTYRGHTVLKSLVRCHFSPVHTTGQQYIYSGCSSGAVIIYDVLTGRIISQLRGHSGPVRDVSWHPYQQVICSSSWDGTHIWWEYKPLKYVGT